MRAESFTCEVSQNCMTFHAQPALLILLKTRGITYESRKSARAAREKLHLVVEHQCVGCESIAKPVRACTKPTERYSFFSDGQRAG